MAEPDPLIKSDPLRRDMVRILIEFAPGPYLWLSWSCADICDSFHSHDYPCGEVKSNRMYPLAHEAMLLPPSLTDDLLGYLQCRWEALLFDQLIDSLCAPTPLDTPFLLPYNKPVSY